MAERFKQAVTLCLLLLLLGGCVSGTTTYFRKVDDDIDGTIIGRYPVSDSIAKGVDCYRFDFDGSGRPLTIKYVRSALSTTSFLPYGATQAQFEYSHESEKRIFLNPTGKVIMSERLELRNNQPASISSYGSTGNLDERRTFIRNENGQVSRIIFLNEKGERSSNSDGIHEVRYQYDSKSNKREVRFCDSDGQSKEIDRSGIAIIQNEYDDYGNITEMRYYGADGKPKEDKVWWIALVSSMYDDKGNEIERRHYGIDKKLKEHVGGLAIWRFKYNDRGDTVEVKCYGANEQLKENKSGWAILRTTYDYERNLIESSLYGADGTLKK